MSIQQFRISNSSFVNNLIAKYGAKANAGSSFISPNSTMMKNKKFWTGNLFQFTHSPFTHRYSGTTIDCSPATKISQSQWKFIIRTSCDPFLLSLRDMAYSKLILDVSIQPAGLSIMKSIKWLDSSAILSWAIWLIKRTYQPSLLKKKRQCGYMKRQQSVGGRRILKRRRKKGRKRLFGA